MKEKDITIILLLGFIYIFSYLFILNYKTEKREKEIKQVILYQGEVVNKYIIESHYTNTPSIVEGSVHEKLIPTLYIVTLKNDIGEENQLCVDSLTYINCNLKDKVGLKMKINY